MSIFRSLPSRRDWFSGTHGFGTVGFIYVWRIVIGGFGMSVQNARMGHGRWLQISRVISGLWAHAHFARGAALRGLASFVWSAQGYLVPPLCRSVLVGRRRSENIFFSVFSQRQWGTDGRGPRTAVVGENSGKRRALKNREELKTRRDEAKRFGIDAVAELAGSQWR